MASFLFCLTRKAQPSFPPPNEAGYTALLLRVRPRQISGSQCCHLCSSLKKVPLSLVEQSTCDPPDGIGISFAADIIKGYRQLILVARETATSFTAACLLDDERHESIRSGLLRLCLELRPLAAPPSVIRSRVDPAPGFASLSNDATLRQYGFVVEVGRVKNPNKNPVAQKCVAELGDELLRICTEGGPISQLTLALATANLNTRIRNRGLSAREMWLQRDQFSNSQIPLSDLLLLKQQHSLRIENHPVSKRSKASGGSPRTPTPVQVGDLVYITSDASKTLARDRYLVVSVDGLWCSVRKFFGSELRFTSYRIKLSECYRVQVLADPSSKLSRRYSAVPYPDGLDAEEEIAPAPASQSPPPVSSLAPDVLSAPSVPSHVPVELSAPPVPRADTSPAPSPVPDVHANTPDSQATAAVSEPFGDTTDSEPFVSLGPRRSGRPSRRPAYLEDYVT